MSWIGGLNDSFNQLTSKAGQIGGQLSTFTKEVLAEGDDEELDLGTEVKRLRIRLIEADATNNEHEAQAAKQKQKITRLQDECRTCQLQAHSCTLEYEAKIEKQNKLISKLKHGLGNEEGFQIVSEDEFPASRSRRTFSGGSHDAAEYADVISSQREINHLTEELGKVQEERDRWRSIAQTPQHTNEGEDSMLAKMKDLEIRLHEEVDRHQHEYLALQQANTATVRRYQDEIRILRERLSHDPDMVSSELQQSDAHSHKMALATLTSEIEELREKVRTRNRQLQAQKKSLEEVRQELDLRKANEVDLESQLKTKVTEVERFQSEKIESDTKIDKLQNVLDGVQASLPEYDRNDSYEGIADHVIQLRETRDNYHEKLEELRETMQVVNQSDNNEDLAESDQWHIESSEHSYGQSSDTEDQHLDDRTEDDLPTHSRSGPLPPHMMQPLFQSSPQAPRTQPAEPDERFLIVSPANIENEIQDGDLTLTLQALQKQVDDYELEIAQYEMVQKEWQDEKESLQHMLERYQNEITNGSTKNIERDVVAPPSGDGRAAAVVELKRELDEIQDARANMHKDKMKLLQEKEQLQNAALNLQEELNMSIVEAQTERDNFVELKNNFDKVVSEKTKIEQVLKNIKEELNSSRMEKVELDEAIETLDNQHQDEMSQILQIRDDLNGRLKTTQNQLKLAQEEREDLERRNTDLKNELNALQQKSQDESELLNVREDLASLIDEKQSLEDDLEASQGRISELEMKLQNKEEAVLNAEMSIEDLKVKLGIAENEMFSTEEKFKDLENENKDFVDSLQQEIRNYALALEDSGTRMDIVEEQRRKMEKEHQITLSKMEELKEEHQKFIMEVDVFKDERDNAETEFVLLIKSKDEQVDSLKMELEKLREEDKVRIAEMTFHHEHEAATSEEVSLLKKEILQIHDRLTTSTEDRDRLMDEVNEGEKRRKVLETELEEKKKEVVGLLKKIEDVEDSAVVKIQETLKEHKVKLSKIEEDHQKKISETEENYQKKMCEMEESHERQMSEMKQQHHVEVMTLKEDHDSDLEKLDAEQKKDIQVLLEEREALNHQISLQDERVKFMEQEVDREANIIQEKLQQSDEHRVDEMNQLKSSNERLTNELRHKRSLVETMEEEIKKQLEVQKNTSQKNDEDFAQLHSAVLNEKSLMKSSLEEEKTKLEEKLNEEIHQLKSDFRNQIEKLEDIHTQEIVKTVEEMKSSHLEEMEDVKSRLLQAQNDAKLTEDELRRAQDDLKTLSDHLELEESTWKKDAASAMEKIRAAHKEEIEILRSENDDLIQRTMQESGSSINEELVSTQLSDLRNSNELLLAQNEQLQATSEQHKSEIAQRLNDILGLNNQISVLSDENKRLQVTFTKPEEPIAENSVTDYEATISALKTELENLKTTSKKELAGKQGTTPSDIQNMLEEIRTRDLSGLEKADLSKEDISSLLTLIKERDDVINVLHEENHSLAAQAQSKEAMSDLEGRYKQLNSEKEQMLNVISEKTQENRQLKDEVHKMMDIISAEKNALTKVQEENQALLAKYEGYDREMTKETVTRLSNLISEKDLEIESLKQKCQTLLDVLQQQEQREASATGGSTEPTVSSQQIQGLLRDRDTLSQQIRQLLTERDHLVALVNSKHQEALLFQEEARKAAESLERDAAENSKLQISYGNLVHDYEQLEIKLSSVQKELSRFKESLNHLEESKEILVSKIEEQRPSASGAPGVSSVMENLRSDSSKGGKTKVELENILEKNKESLLQKDLLLQESIDKSGTQDKKILQLQHDLREKDILIHQKMEETKRLSNDLDQKTNEVGILRKSVENLREQVSGVTYESGLLREKIKNSERASDEKDSESQAFQETNAQLSIMLKEREYELETLREKVTSLSDILKQHEQGKDYESQKYLEELDRAKKQTTNAKHERDQIMLTLKQKQIETQRASEDVRQLRDKESKLQSELTRLRGHLVQVEETYTQEAVLSREREQALRNRLDQIQSKNATTLEAHENSKQQIESLQEQIRSTAQQRDQAIHNFQLAKEQSSQYAAALQQLQVAAERMQREEAATYSALVDKINQQYLVKVNAAEHLYAQVVDLKTKLDEANVALESASRLNEQLEIKERTIDQLKGLVSEKQLQFEEIQDSLHEVKAKSENMVDRQLVKNLLIGYFTSPTSKQEDVKRLITSMIGFSKEEEAKMQPAKIGWVGGWLPWGRGQQTPQGHSPQHHKEDLNQSFTGMFVKFLEEESTSKLPAARLPAAAMVSEAQQRMTQRKIAAEGIPTPAFNPPQTDGKSPPERSTVAGRYNPFLVSNSPVTGTSSGHTTSHPLMQPVTPILPTFTPIANMKPSIERDILKDILQSDKQSS